jgi:hypothetical protein
MEDKVAKAYREEASGQYRLGYKDRYYEDIYVPNRKPGLRLESKLV